jgi:hypothetical protein
VPGGLGGECLPGGDGLLCCAERLPEPHSGEGEVEYHWAEGKCVLDDGAVVLSAKADDFPEPIEPLVE